MDWGNAQNVLARVTWKHGACTRLSFLDPVGP